jgi:Protein of unknown function (DUF3010)
MNVVGFYLKADQLRIVTLSGTKLKHTRIEEKFNKLSIPRDNNPDKIEQIKATLISFLEANNIENIGVNGRAISGRMAGSPLSFKSEGILIAISNMLVKNIFPQTIRATDKKRLEDKTSRPSTKDLASSYDVAFELLPE